AGRAVLVRVYADRVLVVLDGEVVADHPRSFRRHHVVYDPWHYLPAAYGQDLPSAVACLQEDFEACIAHLKFPLAHRRAIRTTNLLERLFGEERRRSKVIPHAFGERAVLKLMFAAVVRAAGPRAGLGVAGFA